MNTQEFLNHLEQLNIQIHIEEGDLSLQDPSGVLTPELNSEFLSRRPELLEYLEAEGSPAVGVPTEVQFVGTPTVDGELVPLSPPQENLFLGVPLLGPRNLTSTLELKGPLDSALLLRSFQALTDQNEILRLSFSDSTGQTQQKLVSSSTVKLNRKNLRDFDRKLLPERIETLIQSENQAKINPEKDPLYRLTLLLLTPEEHILIITFHQAICAPAGLNPLLRDLFVLYETGAPETSEINALTPHPLSTETRNPVINELPLASPPGDRKGAAKPVYKNGVESLLIPSETIQPLRAVFEKEDVPFQTGLLAVFQYLLAIFSGEKEFISLYNTSPGERKNGETYLLTSRVIEENGFLEYLQSVWIESERALAVGSPSLEFYQREDLLKMEGVSFTWIASPGQFTIGEGLHLKTLDNRRCPDSTRMDFSVFEEQSGGNLHCRLNYNTELYEQATIHSMNKTFLHLLEQFGKTPEKPMREISLLSMEDLKPWLELNNTARPQPEGNLNSLFEEQVEKHPDRIALLTAEGKEFTYGNLNKAADELCSSIAEHALVTTGENIVICLQKSEEQAVAILAILKLGGVFTPLDPKAPRGHVDFVLRDTRTRTVVTTGEFKKLFSGGSRRLIILDELAEESEPEKEKEKGRERPMVDADNTACVLYTSGTSGRPKGVAVPHNALIRLVRNVSFFNYDEEQKMALASNFAFDAYAFEFWGALLNGGSLTEIPPQTLNAPEELGELLKKNGIHTLFLTTFIFHKLARKNPDIFSSVTNLLVGGETADPVIFKKVLTKGAPKRLLNMYGPLENTVFSTYHEVNLEQLKNQNLEIPIGKPVQNSMALVLDEFRRPVPPGAPGELYLGGRGLARGYFRRAEQTAERFLHVILAGNAKIRLFRTGDWSRLSQDGTLQFLGRKDNQIKVDGIRLEPGEIEFHLREHPFVAAAAVVLHNRKKNGKLRGFLVLETELDSEVTQKSVTDQCRAALRKVFPANLLPDKIVFLKEMPLLASGKIDRFALENHGLKSARKKPVDVPVTPTAPVVEAAPVTPMADGVPLPLIALQKAGDLPPVFFIHAANGTPVVYERLGAALGTSRPVYGVQAPGLDAGDAFNDFGKQADFYIEAIRKVRPKGPYLLGGWSTGGVLAYEIAARLKASGEADVKVMLFDSMLLQFWFNSLLRIPINTVTDIITQLTSPFSMKWPVNLRELGTLLEPLGYRLPPESDGFAFFTRFVGELIRFGPVLFSSYQGYLSYEPPVFEGDALLIRSERGFSGESKGDPVAEGWGGFVRGELSVEYMETAHMSMLDARNAPTLAAHINKFLEG